MGRALMSNMINRAINGVETIQNEGSKPSRATHIRLKVDCAHANNLMEDCVWTWYACHLLLNLCSGNM
jgi:hypothetical protein